MKQVLKDFLLGLFATALSFVVGGGLYQMFVEFLVLNNRWAILGLFITSIFVFVTAILWIWFLGQSIRKNL